MKKRLYQNFFILCIGIFLRGIILNYLQNHPGEKSSIIPSLQILQQKALGIGFYIIGKDPEIIKIKSDLIKNFNELMYLVNENPSCVDNDLVQSIEKRKQELEQMNYNSIMIEKYLYYSLAIDFKNKIDSACSL